jgi:hypothetical protein
VHFGFGLYKPVRLSVRWPDGTVKTFTPPTNAIFVAKR